MSADGHRCCVNPMCEGSSGPCDEPCTTGLVPASYTEETRWDANTSTLHHAVTTTYRVATPAPIGDQDPPPFEPDEPAQPLPPPGELVNVTRSEFGGMLVGQRGQPVVVNIWASWCAPCQLDLPLLQAASVAHADELTIIGLVVHDDAATAQGNIDDLGITFPTVFDHTDAIYNALAITGFPTTVAFDADGRIQARTNTFGTEEALDAFIADLLA